VPATLAEAGKAAFPKCKSPRSVPDEKWEKLVIAHRTWHHILFSDGLGCKHDNYLKYLKEIAQKIAENKI